MGRLKNENEPEVLVGEVYDVFVASCVIRMLTLATTAPEGSVTVPAIDPRRLGESSGRQNDDRHKKMETSHCSLTSLNESLR